MAENCDFQQQKLRKNSPGLGKRRNPDAEVDTTVHHARGRLPTPEAIGLENQAITELTALGYPPGTYPAQFRPSSLLRKARLMLELSGQIFTEYWGWSDDAIRAAVMKRVSRRTHETDAGAKLEEFLKTRSLDSPLPYIRCKPSVVLEILLWIESRGVPFEGEWPWVNASAHQRNDGVEKKWREITREKREEELAECYGFDKNKIPYYAKSNDPDALVPYCRLAKRLGYDPLIMIRRARNVGNIRNTQIRLAKRLRRQTKGPHPLSGKEAFWLEKQNYIEALLADPQTAALDRTPLLTLEALLDAATSSEFRKIQKTPTTPDPTPQLETLFGPLRERVEIQKAVDDAMRYHRLTYTDAEYFRTPEQRARKILQTIQRLEQSQQPVTADLLYETDEKGDDEEWASAEDAPLSEEITDGFDDLLDKNLIASIGAPFTDDEVANLTTTESESPTPPPLYVLTFEAITAGGGGLPTELYDSCQDDVYLFILGDNAKTKKPGAPLKVQVQIVNKKGTPLNPKTFWVTETFLEQATLPSTTEPHSKLNPSIVSTTAQTTNLRLTDVAFTGRTHLSASKGGIGKTRKKPFGWGDDST